MADKFRYFISDEESWNNKRIQKELKEQDVIYNSSWCHGFRVIPREDSNPLIELLCEDDGQLFSEEISFDVYWAEKIIEALQETIKYTKEKYILPNPKAINCKHYRCGYCLESKDVKDCNDVCDKFEWCRWIYSGKN